MNTLALLWLVVFAIAALLFFGLAAVISVLGFRDLRDLLSGAAKKSPGKEALRQ